MQTTRQDEVQTYVLKESKEEEIEKTETERIEITFLYILTQIFVAMIQLLYLITILYSSTVLYYTVL